MSARLQELLRQKALLDEQAAWLAREIAAEQERTGAGATPVAPPVPTAARGPAVAPPAAVDAEAEAIIDQYRDSSQNVQKQVKRGCILYLLAAIALIALGVFAIYVIYNGKTRAPAPPPAQRPVRSP